MIRDWSPERSTGHCCCCTLWVFSRNPDDPPDGNLRDLISGFRIWSATTMPGISQRHSEQRVSIKGLKKALMAGG